LKKAKEDKNLMVKTSTNNYAPGNGGGFKPHRDYEDMIGDSIQKKHG